MDIASQPTLAVLGAGPKALALAAKTQVLAQHGYAVPRLVVIDPQGWAGNWGGATGYTDGTPTLGTPPEKDVGFPYAPSWGAASDVINQAARHFGWHSYLLHTGEYADWVDRARPQPSHRQWAAYLRWVGERLGLAPLRAAVAAIDLADGRWQLACIAADTGASQRVACDGLVVTGPGTPVRVPGQPDDERVLDGKTFWERRSAFTGLAAPVTVGVVGNGETAGAVVVALLDTLPAGSVVELISPQGVLYSRGESFGENRLYSQPEPDWPRLAERHRREFLKRTDRGVFSLQVERVLAAAERVRTVAGRATRIVAHPSHIQLDVAYEDAEEQLGFDFVVVAIGFDPLWFARLLAPAAREALARSVGEGPGASPHAAAIEHAIGHDLAIVNLRPRLHLPMLAGLAQGPGFPNLSSLGLLADRVLGAYVQPPERLPADELRERVAQPEQRNHP